MSQDTRAPLTKVYLIVTEMGGVIREVRAYRTKQEWDAALPLLEDQYGIRDENCANGVVPFVLDLTTLVAI